MGNSDSNLNPPLAYLLTWTTYGTWLPGDNRGWQNKLIKEVQSPNTNLYKYAQQKMVETTFYISPSDRVVLEREIIAYCHSKRWFLRAISVRSNHIHTLISVENLHPKTVCQRLKAISTIALKRSHNNRKKFWTEGCSTRYIFNEESLESAFIYVTETQDDFEQQEYRRLW